MSPRYELVPQLKLYDHLGIEWVPYLIYLLELGIFCLEGAIRLAVILCGFNTIALIGLRELQPNGIEVLKAKKKSIEKSLSFSISEPST